MPASSTSIIPCPLQYQARTRPDTPALLTSDEQFTFAELHHEVEAAVYQLHRLGIRCGSRIALYAEEGSTYVITLLALWRMGAVAIPINLRYPPEQLDRLLRQVSADRLITERSWIPRIQASIPIIACDTLRPDSFTPLFESKRWQSLQHPATILFTSGSTALPKAVLHTYGNHFFSARGANEHLPLEVGDRWLMVLPLYHVGGLAIIFRCLLAGATMVLGCKQEPLPDQIEAFHITHVSLVATQFKRWLDSERPVPEHVRVILLGGSAIPASLIRRAEAQQLPIYLTYGMTEAASQVTTTRPGEAFACPGASGHLLPYRELRLGEHDEIHVRGKTLCQGYVEGKAVHRITDEEGWYHTGDRGYLDEEGRLFVTGRLDNMFIAGGENIYPEEIEEALHALPEVSQALVVPVPDETFGYRPGAFIQWAGTPLSLEDVRTRLRPHLARYKLPVVLFPWPEHAGKGSLKLSRTHFSELAARYMERMP